ncbi:Zinc/iron permease [Hypomontagnella monticulosa]|nr:Zinc/iron permease [Hypomontagnella monticulosa]
MAGTGLFILFALTVVMALASFLAGALPLSMSLSQSQLRLISSIGIGILVGTSLIVIIPEGIEAITEASIPVHSQNTRNLYNPRHNSQVRWAREAPLDSRNELDWCAVRLGGCKDQKTLDTKLEPVVPKDQESHVDSILHIRKPAEEPEATPSDDTKAGPENHHDGEVPTFYIGLSLVLGFVLMFLIDRLPRHASENFQPPPAPRHISLSNLGGSSLSTEEEESEGFLGSLTPTPKQSRSLATTTGLVIHAAADGIAMGASATSSDTKLGFIVFIAIMVHKAPAAFGLTSVLLKQGLSKRAARGHLIVFSLASPFGAWATYILVSFLGGGGESQLNQWWTGMLLLFSAGTFLYVAMHAMQEGDSPSGHDVGSHANGYPDASQRKHHHPQMRETLATVIGMFLPLLTQFGHHH